MDNPFIISGYESPAYYCDRYKELQRWFDYFKNGQNWMVTSKTGMGKTSLNFHFLDHLKRKNQYFDHLYVDLFLVQSIEDIIQSLVSALLKKAGPDHTQWPPQLVDLIREMGASIRFDLFSGRPSVELDQQRKHSSQKILHALFTYLSKDKTPWIIICDEWQQSYRFNLDALHHLWKDIMDSYPRIRFILLADESEQQRDFLQRNGIDLPLHHERIEPIEANVYLPFIKSLFQKGGKEISGESLQFIYTSMKGETAGIQWVCHRLYQMYDHIQITEVKKCLEKIVKEKESEFKQLYLLITPTQWKLLTAIADCGTVRQPLSSDFIQKYDLRSPSTVQTALKALEQKSLIRKNAAYEVQNVFLSLWMKKSLEAGPPVESV